MNGVGVSEVRDLRMRAIRVLNGSQTGRYKKLDLARDVVRLCDELDRLRASRVQNSQPKEPE